MLDSPPDGLKGERENAGSGGGSHPEPIRRHKLVRVTTLAVGSVILRALRPLDAQLSSREAHIVGRQLWPGEAKVRPQKEASDGAPVPLSIVHMAAVWWLFGGLGRLRKLLSSFGPTEGQRLGKGRAMRQSS